MSGSDQYAPSRVWDSIFIEHELTGSELNPDGWWLPLYPRSFEQYGLRRIIDLGCGIGADAVALARHGYDVTALDFSTIALNRAQQKSMSLPIAALLQADLTSPLPFKQDTFDGAMSNVALHMFSDEVTRRIFAEIYRILRVGGLFMFHVNSVDDMPYRAKRYPRLKELEPYFFLEAHGQTMHFFSEAYCRELLSDWIILHLEHHELRDENGEVLKCVLQCITQKKNTVV